MSQLAMLHTMENIPSVPFRDGFSIRNFRPGEEMDWVKICRCGLCAPDAGIESWENAILGPAKNGEDLVPERDVLFVVDGNDRPVATITAFIRPNGRGDIHMVAALDTVRGHGIGEAMLSCAMHKLDREMTGETRFTHLTTDDFRLPAIVGYLRGGFRPVEYDVGMPERWHAIFAILRETKEFPAVEMVTEDGAGTGILL